MKKILFSLFGVSILMTGQSMAGQLSTSETNGICDCVNYGLAMGDSKFVSNCAQFQSAKMNETNRQNPAQNPLLLPANHMPASVPAAGAQVNPGMFQQQAPGQLMPQ